LVTINALIFFSRMTNMRSRRRSMFGRYITRSIIPFSGILFGSTRLWTDVGNARGFLLGQRDAFKFLNSLQFHWRVPDA
jgi:hypothetical protein